MVEGDELGVSLGQPLVDPDGLGRGHRAHAVDQGAPAAETPQRAFEELTLQERQPLDVSGPHAPAGVGAPAQRAQTRARGVDEQAIEGRVTHGRPPPVGDDHAHVGQPEASRIGGHDPSPRLVHVASHDE